jgi:hypothetical protein
MMTPVRFVGACAIIGLVGCSGSDFSSGTGGRLSDGGSAAGGQIGHEAGGANNGNGGRTGVGGRGAGGRGAGGNGTGGSGAGGRGTGGRGAGGANPTGGTSGSGGAGTGTGGTSVGGGVGTGGAPANSGDCTLDRSTCGANSRCVEITPGGYRVCTTHFPEATSCSGAQECCQSSDCKAGATCYPTPLAPTCGGIVMIDSNVCASDMCASDADCGATEICVPAGTLDRKVRMCVPHGCHRDTDCNAATGGVCAPVSGGCCSGGIGLYCVYPGVGCRKNADCASGNCTIDSKGASQCSTSRLVCPL